MASKTRFERPFLLSTLLIVLSILAFVFNGILVYTGIFYKEAESGLEIYLADTFAKFPFIVIYILLLFFDLLLLISVILMWMRKRLGLFLYFSWSFALILLLLFADQFDWFNALLLLAIVVVLSLNFKYFFINATLKEEKD